ncbi:type II secretion system protein [Cellulomonas humilata]|uniref:Type II secretion system protein n=1 Tax=Cellulomonas humilata TaxID=144055 RepID=A0A7Y6A0S6_9CELL|nr:type II secretion system protein [Cellulomonas humilata]NUU17654.1 type II secretion system protein [Cellulomonas humilata]
MRRSAELDLRDEGGFTLIEVVVALFLLGIVATAGLTFFFRGMQNTSHLQRTQTAVAVANEAMEKVRAVTPRIADTVTATSGLLIGRSQTAVQAAWAAAAAADTSQSNAVWDTAAATRPQVAIPVVDTVRVSDETFTTTTLIGTCYRLKAASATDQTCVKTNPGITAVQLYRVTVVVTWEAGTSGQCAAGTCSYRLSTLVDPTLDANWNLTAKPVTYDDTSTMVTGGAADVINTLANDVIGFVPAGVNPTTITSPPSIGTAATVASGTEIGRIRYTPPANASGITTLRYRLKDGAGRTSNEATLTVSVRPLATAFAQTVETSSTTTWSVPAYGTGLDVVIVSGTATVSGNTLTYASGATAGSAVIKYKVVDDSGLESDTVNLTVTVVVPSPPAVTDVATTIVAAPGPATTTQDLKILDQLGLSPKTAYSVTWVPASTVIKAATGTTPGTVVQSAPKTELNWVMSSASGFNQVGVYETRFTVAKGTSAQSAQKKVTVSVRPLATAFTDPTSVSGGASKVVAMPTTNAPNVVPTTGVTYLVAPGTVPVCSIGTANVSSQPSVTAGTTAAPTFKAPKWTSGNGTGTCTFPYWMVWNASGYTLTSDTVVATMKVTK